MASLWGKDRFRWAMHGLVLYGFTGLMVADALIQIKNPMRAEMALSDPVKLLAMGSGVAVLVGADGVAVYVGNAVLVAPELM